VRSSFQLVLALFQFPCAAKQGGDFPFPPCLRRQLAVSSQGRQAESDSVWLPDYYIGQSVENITQSFPTLKELESHTEWPWKQLLPWGREVLLCIVWFMLPRAPPLRPCDVLCLVSAEPWGLESLESSACGSRRRAQKVVGRRRGRSLHSSFKASWNLAAAEDWEKYSGVPSNGMYSFKLEATVHVNH
jgi:hypothetical protein